MFADALAFTLVPGPLDQTVFSPRCQTELQRFDDQLRAGGIRAETVTFRTADGAGLTGEFVIPPAQPVGAALPEVAASWLRGGAGRTLRLKVGDLEVEARTIEEVGQLLQRAQALQGSREDKNDEA
ncbi:hypothetical protein P0D88_41435 [Paraburkholderia sp. RL18-103-BIB-C]|uniref:hypothetical protein n=1 Tax=unclassified Paraburkholderia TaxID=2615204 RepID=UPI0038B866B6